MRTLQHRGDVSTGWSMAWKLNWWARLKDGNRALDVLAAGIQPKDQGGATYGNLFSSAHGAVQLDANFGGSAGIAELLLQSYAGYIHLLPALPDAWHSGSIRGLVARGGFVVDMAWAEGELQSFTIHSKLGGNCRLLLDGPLTSPDVELIPALGHNPNPLLQQPDPAPYIKKSEAALPDISDVSGGLYDFPTEAGQPYHFKRK